MDILDYVDESLIEYKLKLPNGKDTGFTFWIAPFGFDGEVDAWLRSRSIAMYRRAKEAGVDASDNDVAALDLEVDIRRAVSSVRKWDIPEGSTLAGVASGAECSTENKEKVFRNPIAFWIVEAIFRARVAAVNFTMPPEKD